MRTAEAGTAPPWFTCLGGFHVASGAGGEPPCQHQRAEGRERRSSDESTLIKQEAQENDTYPGLTGAVPDTHPCTRLPISGNFHQPAPSQDKGSQREG